MSKTKIKNKNRASVNKKSKTKKSKIILGVVLVLVVITAAAAVIINSVLPNAKKDLCNYHWISASAENTSGDEVDMADIYNTKYSAYQGTLDFKDDGTFTFWLTPGDSTDGTHSGKYKLDDNGSITADFDDGTKTSFETLSEQGNITAIFVNYDEYKVKFIKADSNS